ncbi:MAG: hypothetical protein QXT19_04935 [Candidatus Woesearchaeota archaeon]
MSDRKPTYKNKLLCTKNIIALMNNFIEAGYFGIVEGVFAEQDLLDCLKTKINGTYKLIRLHCAREICYERDKNSDRPFVCGKNCIDIAYNLYEANAKNNLEEIVIDNSNTSVDKVVDLIVDAIKSKTPSLNGATRI